MCNNIVGTEDNVKSLRMINTVRDNLSRNEIETTITSGSFGEGLDMRGSDVDLVKVISFIEVCENINGPFNPDKTYFTMETGEAQPGYTLLRLIHSKNLKMFELCNEIEGEYYFSNLKIKQLFLHKFSSIIHGPCVSDNDGFTDNAYTIHNRSWITQAEEWKTRSKNAWPENDVKQSIIKHGVLFVPKGVQGSKKEELEWRISFSVGEKFLIYTFTHTQLLCYALMKILLKGVIDTDFECQELLSSYFMKTILFWISEEFPLSIWRPENLISNFMMCVKRLIYCVENSVCPHYFIPENNLFKHKIKGHAKETLLNKLNILDSYGWRCILFSDQMSNFNELALYKEVHLMYGENLKLLMSPSMRLRDRSIASSSDHLSWKKGIHMVLSNNSSKIRDFYSFYTSTILFYSDNFLTFDDIRDNKSTYKQYKTCISTVLLNARHDAVSGWLKLASFFYRTKQYNIALAILQYSLLKCSPEKLYFGIRLSHIHNEILSLHLFKRMTVTRLKKMLLFNHLRFTKNCTLLPDELQIKENLSYYQIPPEVYVHFLSFLCHYNMKNIIPCQHSLQDLQLTIEEEHFIASDSDRAISYNILGIVFQVLGDIESARRAFINSIELEADPDLNTAFRNLFLIGGM
ncbi:uncharacterized protein LOC127715220 [Mytilus californianus]|uniref:uncharacterized protein LOC127715220 n=1 Tax=Mytilus californianus TaxID=6549 RepID=UPI0022450348|nr:uncharacterized protein LOC127715220 [Mytilus californianus]